MTPWPGPTSRKPPTAALSTPGLVAVPPRWPTRTHTPRKSLRAPRTALAGAGWCAPRPGGRLRVARGRGGGVGGAARLCGATVRLRTRPHAGVGLLLFLFWPQIGLVGALLVALAGAARVVRGGRAHHRHRRLRLDGAAPPRPRSVQDRPVGRLAPVKEQQAQAGQRAGLRMGKSGSAFATVRAPYQSSSGLRRMCC